MGNPITIQSQVDSDEFVKLLVQLINDQGSSPNWSGWNTFEKINKNKSIIPIHIRVRSIDAVERIEQIQESG